MTRAVRIPEAEVWWIDETGTWHAADATYADRFPDCTFQNLTQFQGPWFKELGMIKVAKLGGMIDIQWDVRHASPEAVRSMFNYLLTFEAPGSRGFHVGLKYFFGAWNSEMFPTPGEALDRIAELSACEGLEADESITIANVSLDNIGDNDIEIHYAYMVWQESKGCIGNVGSDDLDRLKRRSFSMRPDVHGEKFVIVDAGEDSLSAALLGADWPEVALGMTPQNCFSDEDYECEMCQDYPTVIKSGVPRLDHVRAFIHLTGDDPIWLNYERLLLPWTTAAGGPLLMCCSEASQHLEVEFLDAVVAQDTISVP